MYQIQPNSCKMQMPKLIRTKLQNQGIQKNLFFKCIMLFFVNQDTPNSSLLRNIKIKIDQNPYRPKIMMQFPATLSRPLNVIRLRRIWTTCYWLCRCSHCESAEEVLSKFSMNIFAPWHESMTSIQNSLPNYKAIFFYYGYVYNIL